MIFHTLNDADGKEEVFTKPASTITLDDDESH